MKFKLVIFFIFFHKMCFCNIDNILIRVFDSYSNGGDFYIQARVSYFDSIMPTKLLASNSVVLSKNREVSYVESENDYLQYNDSKYFVSISMKDSLITYMKMDTNNSKKTSFSSFIDFIKKYEGKFVILSSSIGQITVGIQTPDMPNNIITYTIDTIENKLKRFTMLKDFFNENGKIITRLISLDFLVEERNSSKYLSLEGQNIVYKETQNGEIDWSPRFKKYKKEFRN